MRLICALESMLGDGLEAPNQERCPWEKAGEGRYLTGFVELDRLIGGIPEQGMTIIGAEPGIGTTSFALSLALSAAKQGARVAYFTLDSCINNIASRLLSMEAGLENEVHVGETRTCPEQSELDAARLLCGLDFFIEDTPGLSANEIRERALAIQLAGAQSEGPESDRTLIFVDYLGLVDSQMQDKAFGFQEGEPFRSAWEKRRSEIAPKVYMAVSADLWQMAIELECPVFVCCCMPRLFPRRRPNIRDLRDRGVELAADVAILIDRSTDRDEASGEERPDWGTAEIIVAKNRWGHTGSVWLNFDEEYAGLNKY